MNLFIKLGDVAYETNRAMDSRVESDISPPLLERRETKTEARTVVGEMGGGLRSQNEATSTLVAKLEQCSLKAGAVIILGDMLFYSATFAAFRLKLKNVRGCLSEALLSSGRE